MTVSRDLQEVFPLQIGELWRSLPKGVVGTREAFKSAAEPGQALSKELDGEQ